MRTIGDVREKLRRCEFFLPCDSEYAVGVVEWQTRVRRYMAFIGLPAFDGVHICRLPSRKHQWLPLLPAARTLIEGGVSYTDVKATVQELEKYEGTDTLRFLFISIKGVASLVVHPHELKLPKARLPVVVQA